MPASKTTPGRPRGRPALKDDEIAANRARIAAAALRLFHAEGYEAVSMRRLAREADCTVATIYAYFGGKIGVLHALWEAVFAEIFEELGPVAAAERDPRARLAAVSQGYVAYWLANPQTYFMVFMTGGISREDVTDFVSQTDVVARFDLFRNCLAQAAPALDPASVDSRSEALLCALNGIAQALITINGHEWAPPEQLVDVILEGVLSPPAEGASDTK